VIDELVQLAETSAAWTAGVPSSIDRSPAGWLRFSLPAQ
jgi:hypothetical protein